MMQYTHSKLLQVLKKAYPDEYEKYKSFYVIFEFAEKKQMSKYDFGKRSITCATLSRSPSDLFLSLLEELAHHVDIKKRGETHQDPVYFAVCKKLIDAALKINTITLQELYGSRNEKLKRVLQESFGSFRNWKYTVEPDYEHIYILVFDSFMIRNVLKAEQYWYDPDQRAWSKMVKRDTFEDEHYFIEKYRHKATFKIINDNAYYIRPSYSLKVETYSIKDAELWSAFSYIFDVKKKRWCKCIYADELKQELELIADLPKQKVLISRIK